MDARELEDRKIPYTPAFIRTTCTLTYQRGYEEIYVDKLITADGLGVYALSREDIDVWKCAGPYRDIAIENATTDLLRRIEALEGKLLKYANDRTKWEHGYIILNPDNKPVIPPLSMTLERLTPRIKTRVQDLLVFDDYVTAKNYRENEKIHFNWYVWVCKYKPSHNTSQLPHMIFANEIKIKYRVGDRND